MLDLKALLAKILLRITPTILSVGNTSGSWECLGLLIQFGSNTQSVSSATTQTWNTTFGTPYKYTPVVFTQIVNTQAPNVFHVVANNITTTGCQWLRSSSLSTAYNCTIHWVAIGFSNGGGYLTSKLYATFSHLERWWEHVRPKGFIGENAERKTTFVRQLHDSFKNIRRQHDDMAVLPQSEHSRPRGLRACRDSRSITISPIIARVRSNYSLSVIWTQDCWVHKKHRKFCTDRFNNIIAIICKRRSFRHLDTDRGCLPC